MFKKCGIRFETEEFKEVTKVLERVPIVHIKWSMAAVNELNEPQEGELLEEGGEAQMIINVRRVNKANTQGVGISNFPKYKEASWFLIVANAATKEIIVLKRMAFKRFSSKELILMLPDDFTYERLELYFMCDSYIGLDQQYTIDLNKVNSTMAAQRNPQDTKKTWKKSTHEVVKEQIKAKADEEDNDKYEIFGDICKPFEAQETTTGTGENKRP